MLTLTWVRLRVLCLSSITCLVDAKEAIQDRILKMSTPSPSRQGTDCRGTRMVKSC